MIHLFMIISVPYRSSTKLYNFCFTNNYNTFSEKADFLDESPRSSWSFPLGSC